MLSALSDLYRSARGDELGSIGLLCRRGDAQLAELQFLCERFRREGVDAHVVHPDELVLQRGTLHFRGRALQLIYRHLFLSRLDRSPARDLEAVIAAPLSVRYSQRRLPLTGSNATNSPT